MKSVFETARVIEVTVTDHDGVKRSEGAAKGSGVLQEDISLAGIEEEPVSIRLDQH